MSVTVEDLFAAKPENDAIWRVGIVILRFLRSHNIMEVDDYPQRRFLPQRYITDFLVFEMYSTRFSFKQDIVCNYPILPSIRQHERFAEERFVLIYNHFYINHARHVAFCVVWVYAMELILHTVYLGYNRHYIRSTCLLMARVLSGEEFKKKTSFSAVRAYAKMKVDWQNFAGNLVVAKKNLMKIRTAGPKYNFTINNFLVFMRDG